MGNKKAFDRLEVWIVSGAIVTLVITLTVVAYSIGTLSRELYNAFSPAQSSISAVNFDIRGYNSLGL